MIAAATSGNAADGRVGGHRDRRCHEFRLTGEHDATAMRAMRFDPHICAEMRQHLFGVIARRLGFDDDRLAWRR